MSDWSWVRDPASVAARRAQLLGLLGTLPPRTARPTGECLHAEARADARIEQWRLELNGIEPVPALLVLPAQQALRAVVLYCHAHGNCFDCGKDELLLRRPAIAQPPYGELLPAMGIAALAIDHWGFGERATLSERLLNKRFLSNGRTLWGMRVADTLAAFDWLGTQSALAGRTVIALGLSMGSTMACWTAALEPRIAAVADLCCLAEFDALVASGNDDLHGEYFFVPGLRRHFSAAQINALIAPRPHLSCAGADDPLTPPAGLASIDAALAAAYAEAGAASNWQQRVFAGGHQETVAMRAAVLDFFQRVIVREK